MSVIDDGALTWNYQGYWGTNAGYGPAWLELLQNLNQRCDFMGVTRPTVALMQTNPAVDPVSPVGLCSSGQTPVNARDMLSAMQTALNTLETDADWRDSDGTAYSGFDLTPVDCTNRANLLTAVYQILESLNDHRYTGELDPTDRYIHMLGATGASFDVQSGFVNPPVDMGPFTPYSPWIVGWYYPSWPSIRLLAWNFKMNASGEWRGGSHCTDYTYAIRQQADPVSAVRISYNFGIVVRTTDGSVRTHPEWVIGSFAPGVSIKLDGVEISQWNPSYNLAALSPWVGTPYGWQVIAGSVTNVVTIDSPPSGYKDSSLVLSFSPQGLGWDYGTYGRIQREVFFYGSWSVTFLPI